MFFILSEKSCYCPFGLQNGAFNITKNCALIRDEKKSDLRFSEIKRKKIDCNNYLYFSDKSYRIDTLPGFVNPNFIIKFIELEVRNYSINPLDKEYVKITVHYINNNGNIMDQCEVKLIGGAYFESFKKTPRELGLKFIKYIDKNPELRNNYFVQRPLRIIQGAQYY